MHIQSITLRGWVGASGGHLERVAAIAVRRWCCCRLRLDRFDHWRIEKKAFSVFATANGYNYFVEATTCRAVERVLAELVRNSRRFSPSRCKPSIGRDKRYETNSESGLSTPKSFGQRSGRTRNGPRNGAGRHGRPSKARRVSNRRSVQGKASVSR